jgi:AraC-like DNA-binding protein
VPRQLEDAVRLAALRELGRVHNSGLAERLKTELEHRYSEPIALGPLAQEHGMDVFYLIRAFKRSYGIAPGQYVRFLRTEHFAWEALRQRATGVRLSRLALDAGFGDYSTFCRGIREHFGVPPSALIERSA